jgi:hypothetical protein
VDKQSGHITTLDHVEGITVDGDVFTEPANEYWALRSLWDGLEFLARQASDCDNIARQQLNPDGNFEIFSYGNDPDLKGIPLGLLTCAFHWYAVTACQYVRTVGAIAKRLDSTRPSPPKYVAQVIPEVQAYRDKVAAHFAWASMHERDNDAERAASIMPAVTFQNDSFFVGAMTLIIRAHGKTSDSRSIEPWSINSIHGRLRARYWPDKNKQDR